MVRKQTLVLGLAQAAVGQDCVYVLTEQPGGVVALRRLDQHAVGAQTLPDCDPGSCELTALAVDRTQRIDSVARADTVLVLNLAAGTVAATVPVGGHPSGAALTPDGGRLYVTNRATNDVSVVDTTSRTVIKTIAMENQPSAVAIISYGSRAFVVNGGSDSMSIISISEGLVMNTTNGNGSVTINEFVLGVTIGLDEAPLSACPAFDPNHDGAVTISDLIAAVDAALSGCPAPFA